tara:strand:- start:16669 stop:18972 length:2304 start_codon:yes stop_codon:yes gene_type:complete
MVSLDFTNPVKSNDIIGWKSDRGWLYLTLLGVRAPKNQIPSATFNGVVRDIVLDDFDESIQVAILVGRPIVGYDIVNSPTDPTTVVFIHTEMKRSEVYSLKKHIEKSGSSIFGQVKTSKFPEYNTNFESAFKRARIELGPNAIFRYDGKLYTTNHPEEEQSKIRDALREKPKGYFKPKPGYQSFDGEIYEDVAEAPKEEKMPKKKTDDQYSFDKSKKDTNPDLELPDKAGEKTKDNLPTDIPSGQVMLAEKTSARKNFGSIIKSIFSKISPRRKIEEKWIDSVSTSSNLIADEKKYLKEIEDLESKIAQLEKGLIKKDDVLKEEQKAWETRAEERQSKYSQQLSELESELIELGDALKEKDHLSLTYQEKQNKILEEKEKQSFSRERKLQDQLKQMGKKLEDLEQEKLIEQKKWLSLSEEKEMKYRTRAKDLEMKLLQLESSLAEKDLELFDEKSKWELLSEQQQNKYRNRAQKLELQLAELQNVIHGRDEKIYAERDKWRQLAKERQQMLDEYEPLVQDFNEQLKNLRQELLSDLYDEKVTLDKQNESSEKNLRDLVIKVKKGLFPDRNAKQEWVDSVYNDLAEDEFAFQEYFALALPDQSESLDEPPPTNKGKKWREDLPTTKRDRYKTGSVDPIFQYYYNGGIRVETNMAGIPIYINGKLVGDTPITIPVQVEPGWHQVSGFSPVYKQVANSEGLSYVGSDPIIRNNQLFGAKTVFVESGKIANVSLKFNSMGNIPKKWREMKGGWVAGFPMVLLLFFFITWSL